MKVVFRHLNLDFLPSVPSLLPDDILSDPAEDVTAGFARPSSRFRGISSPPELIRRLRYSTVGLTRCGACLP